VQDVSIRTGLDERQEKGDLGFRGDKAAKRFKQTKFFISHFGCTGRGAKIERRIQILAFIRGSPRRDTDVRTARRSSRPHRLCSRRGQTILGSGKLKDAQTFCVALSLILVLHRIKMAPNGSGHGKRRFTSHPFSGRLSFSAHTLRH
jgi:hypothetical protein